MIWVIEVFRNATQRKQNDMRFVWEHAHVMLKQILMGNENSFSRIGETFFFCKHENMPKDDSSKLAQIWIP